MPTFISYSQKDAALYEALCKQLDAYGIERWDRQTMRTGASLSDQLREAVNQCGDCIFLATSNSVTSGWCLAEVGAFWGASKRVLPYVPNEITNSSTSGDVDIPKQFKAELWSSDIAKIVGDIKASRLKSVQELPGPLVLVAEPKDPRDKAKLAVIRSAWADEVSAVGQNSARPFYEVHSLAQVVDYGDIGPRQGILLTTPHAQRLSDGLIAHLVAWVRNGGNLAIAGFELGERHHVTNINQLTYHFGIQFNSDVIVGRRSKRSPLDKDYEKTLVYESVRETPPLLFHNVSKIAMKSACSLHLEPGSTPILLAEPNQMIELLPAVAIYSSAPDYKLASGTQEFEKPYPDVKRAVMALAPSGLTGDGRVLALGTWDFRDGGIESNNHQFLRNLWSWLMTKS